MDITVGRKAIADATEKLKNWGRWGKDDQIGTLNHILPEDIVRAAGLIRTGKVFALGIPLDRHGPADRLVRRPLESDPHHARHRHGCGRRPLRQGAGHPLRRRRHQHAGAGRHALGLARPHLLRRKNVQRLRRARSRLQRPRQARHRAHQEQDGRARRAARRGALSRRPLARGRRGDFQRRARQMRQGGECRDPARRFRHPAHRPDGALSAPKGLGRLCGRSGAGRAVRELLLVSREGDRRDLLRHLGRRGAAERDHAKSISPGTGW